LVTLATRTSSCREALASEKKSAAVVLASMLFTLKSLSRLRNRTA
jgi:hypothetical protein